MVTLQDFFQTQTFENLNKHHNRPAASQESRWNPKVWPFKWKLLSSIFLWRCSLCRARCFSNFWVCGGNPKVWPFKWKPLSSTLLWCCLFLDILTYEIPPIIKTSPLLKLSQCLRSRFQKTLAVKNSSFSLDANTRMYGSLRRVKITTSSLKRILPFGGIQFA